MPDATAAPAENGTADGVPAEHSAAPAAESADAATPMETEAKGAEATEVVKKKRTKKHAVPYRAQGVAGLSDKSVQVRTMPVHARVSPCQHGCPEFCSRRMFTMLFAILSAAKLSSLPSALQCTDRWSWTSTTRTFSR